MSKIALIIPCYNEARRLHAQSFLNFLQTHSDFELVFVDDASTDGTDSLLKNMAAEIQHQIHVVSITKNTGKGTAIRSGMHYAMKNIPCDFLGYIDADLSTSLDEFYLLYQELLQNRADFVAGSRIKMLNTNIERSTLRHITGRSIATIIDSRLNLGIYDTQCGAKCFRSELFGIFNEPFVTRWFFDIELFVRLRNQFPEARILEKPLRTWKDPGNSKLTLFSFPLIFKEIISLLRHYRN